MSKLAELLSFLIALGPKASEAWPVIERIIADVQTLVAIFGGRNLEAAGELALSAHEHELMCELQTVLDAHPQPGDEGVMSAERAGFLQRAIAFLAAHKELVSLLLLFMKK